MPVRLFCEEYLNRIPRKPYCTDSLETGLRIRPRDKALQKLYLQLNSPGSCWVLLFDMDQGIPWDVLRTREIPEFTWTVTNPDDNDHFHAAYALKTPVCTSDAGRLAPLRYLAAIERAYRQLLRADPLYTGLITKNPEIVEFWDVAYTDRDGDMSYTLDELASYVLPELKRPKAERPVDGTSGWGRNCYIFESVRLWSYRAIRGYWGRVKEWYDAVEDRCHVVNAEFERSLDCREVRGIARSIAGWTLRRFSPEGFSEAQRRNVLRRWERESRKEDGINLLRAGLTPAEVANACGVTIRSARLWKAEAGLKESTTKTIAPWENKGVSRATWYRNKTYQKGS